MGDPEHRVLLRSAHRFGRPAGRGALQEIALGIDVFVVPALLLLVARDLLVRDPAPIRILAWRLLHNAQLVPAALSVFVPRVPAAVDRDPIALVLATVATLLAGVYLGGAIVGKGTRFRAAVIALAALLVVVLPSSAIMAMGYRLGRPYGQDGGIVQLPLALDKIVSGRSPYDTDYSDSILGKEAQTSRMWSTHGPGPTYGANPLLHHHAYLPGTHLLMMPFHIAARAAGTTFDPRVLTLAAYFAAALLAVRLVSGAAGQLTAAAVVLLNPLVYWHQIFGANDIVFVALILGVALLLRRRPYAAAALLGLACGTKQLAWPFAPFLLLAAPPDWGATRDAVGRVARLALLAGVVFAVVVFPIAALDWHAFYVDIFGYNVGLPGVTNYPLGGTPGFGFANFLLYAGAVKSLGDYFPFGIFYALLIPIGLGFVRVGVGRPTPGRAIALGCGALLASLYLSRVVHPNYLIPLATLLPIAVLAAESLGADVAIVPLLLLAVAAEVAEQSPLRLLWDDAVAAHFPQYVSGFWRWLLPRAGPQLTDDPLTLVWSGLAAGFATAYLVAALLGVGPRLRSLWLLGAVFATVVVPWLVVVGLGERTIVRAQDPWVVEVRGAADRLLSGGRSPDAWAREAVSTSFRDEPARRLEAEHAPIPAGPVVLSALARTVGGAADPRLLSLLAVFALLGLVLAAAPPSQIPWLLAVLVLLPATVSTVVLGGAALLGLLGLTIAALPPARAPRTGTAGLVLASISSLPAGAAAVWLAARREDRRRLAIVGVALALAVLPAAMGVGRSGDLASLLVPDGGVGLVNLPLYAGHAPGLVLVAAVALVVAGGVVAVLRHASAPRAVSAAFVATAVLLVAPSVSPDVVLLPIGLLAVAAASAEASREGLAAAL